MQDIKVTVRNGIEDSPVLTMPRFFDSPIELLLIFLPGEMPALVNQAMDLCLPDAHLLRDNILDPGEGPEETMSNASLSQVHLLRDGRLTGRFIHAPQNLEILF